jgi:hypothetical protein
MSSRHTSTWLVGWRSVTVEVQKTPGSWTLVRSVRWIDDPPSWPCTVKMNSFQFVDNVHAGAWSRTAVRGRRYPGQEASVLSRRESNCSIPTFKIYNRKILTKIWTDRGCHLISSCKSWDATKFCTRCHKKSEITYELCMSRVYDAQLQPSVIHVSKFYFNCSCTCTCALLTYGVVFIIVRVDYHDQYNYVAGYFRAVW